MYFIFIYKICWMKETFQEYVDSDIDRNEALDQCSVILSFQDLYSAVSGWGREYVLCKCCKDKICMLALLYVKNIPLD